jgi:Family of unknown function (DUF6166)
MKIYNGYRDEGTPVITVTSHGRKRSLRPRNDLVNHSPTGFEYGYGGSGPAQLALAILCDIFHDDKLAVRHHQDVKWAFIADLDRDEPWTINERDVREFVTRHPVDVA